jgi:hypothetical protein
MSIEDLIIDEKIMEKIKSIFPSSEFVIKEFNSIIIKTIDDKNCLRLSFYQDNIYIDSLKKCGISGSESLKRVYDLAKLIPNINSINLTDASDINICDIYISLAIVKILTNGISWYNSLGYISDNYDDEKIHNNQIINSDYEQFIDEVYTRHFELFKQKNTIEQFTMDISKFTKKISGIEMIKLSEKYKNDEELYKLDYPDDYHNWLQYQKKISLYQEIIDNYGKYLDDYISTQEKEKRKGIELYPDVKMTIKAYFNYIWDDITRNIKSKGCDEETIDKCRWLSGVISKIITTKILQYNNDLKKNIVRKMGGRKRTKIKKSVKSKTKKVKKSVKSNTKKSKNPKKRNYLKSKK